MGLGLFGYKTMPEALDFNTKAVMGYDIANNILEVHVWSRVRVLVQKTLDDKIMDKIKRRVGQLEKFAREIMEHTSNTDTKSGAVPGNPKGGEQAPTRIPWIDRKSSCLNLSKVYRG
jgi:hypothetical protein